MEGCQDRGCGRGGQMAGRRKRDGMTPVRAQMSAQRFCRASQNADNDTIDCRWLTTEYSPKAKNEILWPRELPGYLRGGLQLFKRSFLERAATSCYLGSRGCELAHMNTKHHTHVDKGRAQELKTSEDDILRSRTRRIGINRHSVASRSKL
jgi:hypothetical protein